MQDAVPPTTARFTREEFARAIEESRTAKEACSRLGIPYNSFRRIRRRLGIPPVEGWANNGLEAMFRSRPPIPEVVIPDSDGRRFVGTLLGTEGCITCEYDKRTDTTELALVVEMTEREWIVKLASVTGLSEPSLSGHDYRDGRKPTFRRAITGLRAVRVLNEVLPYLYGQRLREAKRAIEFFSPKGHVKGRFFAAQIWGSLRH